MPINAPIETSTATIEATYRLAQISSHIATSSKAPISPTVSTMSTSPAQTSAAESTSTPSTTTTTTTTSSPKIPSLTLYHHPLSPFSQKVWITALEHDLTQYITLRQIVVAPVETPKVFPGWSEHNELLGRFNPVGKLPTLVVRERWGDAEEADGKEEEQEEEQGEEYAVYDSKVICEFLVDLAGSIAPVEFQGHSSDNNSSDHHHSYRHSNSNKRQPATHWKRQSLHRLADQMMDAEILAAYEERMRGAEGIMWEAWIKGMRRKIERGVGGLRGAAAVGQGEEGEPLLVKRHLDGTGKVDRESCLGPEEAAVACCLQFLDVREISWRRGGDGEQDELAEWFEACKKRESWKASRPDVKWVGKGL